MSDIHTLSGAYVLNAIDDLERARFDRHLAECPACAAEVAELRETVAALADPTAEVPPRRLRSAVRARIADTPQLRHEPGPVSERPPLHWRRWLAAAAAVVALGGAGTAGYVIANQTGRATTTQADAKARQIVAVLAAPDARLRSTAAGGGQVSVVASASLDEAVAVLTDLPSPGTAHSYQLWVIRNRVPRSVGVLAAGRTEATELVSGVRGAQAFAVSREPAGGSPKPTHVVTQLALA